MTDVQQLVARYLETWNETDAAARQRALETVWEEEATYVDPLVAVQGRDAIDATIAAVQQQFAGLRFSLAGPVDAHHDVARFTWELGAPGEEAMVVGFDVAEVSAAGRLRSVRGFLDKVPASAA
jgi:hypothetical protein